MPKPENVKGKTFKDKPERINRKGRPKYVLTTLREYLEKTYGQRPPKGEVRDMMEYIECLSMQDLKVFIADPKVPVIIQAYGRLLLSGDQKDFRRVQAAEMISDRLHGRPKQATEIGLSGTITQTSEYDLSKLSVRALKELQGAKISKGD